MLTQRKRMFISLPYLQENFFFVCFYTYANARKDGVERDKIACD